MFAFLMCQIGERAGIDRELHAVQRLGAKGK